jgi:hypothetical protein
VTDEKSILLGYLRSSRASILSKVEGLGEYDVRRPMTPTGTNLLGLVKHLAGVEANYFGATFGRPMADPPHWLVDGSFDDDLMIDMFATPEESVEEIVLLYRRACAHADATVEALPLDAPGRVSHWPTGRDATTLLAMLAHVLAETARHAGHADIIREAIDGATGLRAIGDTFQDAGGWPQHVERVEAAARAAASH